MFFLERACKQQVMALSAGRSGVSVVPDAVRDVVTGQMAEGRFFGRLAQLAWPGSLRKLDRHSPGYDA
jgi:hypothetical protein